MLSSLERMIVNKNFHLLLRLGIKELITQVIFDSSIINDSLEEVMR